MKDMTADVYGPIRNLLAGYRLVRPGGRIKWDHAWYQSPELEPYVGQQIYINCDGPNVGDRMYVFCDYYASDFICLFEIHLWPLIEQSGTFSADNRHCMTGVSVYTEGSL